MRIGKANEEIIRSCNIVLGVLDGPELDSGTASEIGFGAALGKKCYGLRTDFRDSGDFDGIPINLQVLYWIEAGGTEQDGHETNTLVCPDLTRMSGILVYVVERTSLGKPVMTESRSGD